MSEGLAKGWEPATNGELCTVLLNLDEENPCREPAIAFSPILSFPMCEFHYSLFRLPQE